MKKILYLILLTIVSMGIVFANGDAEKGADGEPITLRVSTVSGPGDAHTEGLELFKTKLEEYSKGTIKVEVYTSGALFSQSEDFPALLQGDADLVYVSPTFLATHIPKFSMFASAYVFRDYDHMRTVFDGEIGKELFGSVTDKFGIVPLGVFYLGARQLNLRKKINLTSRKDLEGIKLRMPNTPDWLEMGRALGANPSPLAFSEVYLGLKTGTVDGQDNPLGTVKNAKFYEVAKNITITNHLIDTVWPVMSEKAWGKLNAKQRDMVMKAIKDAQKYVDDTNLGRDKALVSELREYGVNVMELDKKTLDSYKTEVQNHYLGNEKISKDWDLDLYKKIQQF